MTNLRPEIFRIPLDKRIYIFEDVDCQGTAVLERGVQQNPVNDHPVSENYHVSEKVDMSFLGFLKLLDELLL